MFVADSYNLWMNMKLFKSAISGCLLWALSCVCAEVFAEATGMEYYKKASQIYLASPDGYIEPADLHRVITEMEKAVELDPGYAEAYFLLGRAYNQRASLFDWNSQEYKSWRKQSQDQFRIAAWLAPENSEYSYILSVCLEYDDPERMHVIREIFRRDPGYAPARESLARHLEDKGDLDEAIKKYMAYIELQKTANREIDGYVLVRVWELLVSAGRKAEAVELVDQYIDPKGNTLWPRYWQGWIFRRSKKMNIETSFPKWRR